MFEKATRMKLRFCYKGQCTVEDLWDLSVNTLDALFKGENAHLKEQEGESLLNKKTEGEKTTELRINIIRHIVTVKLKEREAEKNRILKTARAQKVLGIIEKKQDEELYDMSIEDLNKLIDEENNTE